MSGMPTPAAPADRARHPALAPAAAATEHLIRYGGEFADLIVQEARMEPVIATAMGDQGFVLRSPDLAPLHDATKRIQAIRPS